jgi:uncharacterized protein involved in outer membrane biogenesis
MNSVPAGWSGFPRRHPAWTILLSLLAALIVLLAVFDWNWLKGPVQRLVSQRTGREFRIDGGLDVDLMPLRVHAGKLYLGNASWSGEPAMARIERLDMRVRFWPLLAGRVVLPEVSLVQPRLRLERNAAGSGNWVFANTRDCVAAKCASSVHVGQLRASHGTLQFREPTLRTAVDLQFDSVPPARGEAFAPLVLRGQGTYRKAPFELAGQVDSPLALQGKAQPYRLDLTARAGQTRARLYGALAEPLQTQDVAVNFELRGADLADLYDLAGIVLPVTPPYELKGRLTRHGQRFAYRDFTGTVGDSDLAGHAEMDFGRARPRLTAQLQSRRIDFDDLAGFVGGTPGAGAGETASAAQRQRAGKQQASGRLLPATPIRTDRLRAMDADVLLHAARVESRRLPLEDMTAHLQLDAGQVTLEPLDFGAAGGRLRSTVRLDGRTEPARFGIAMHIEHLQLPKLLPRAGLLQDSAGRIAGSIQLQGEGNSAAGILATSDGDLSLIMGRGRISNLLLEIAGLDIAESLAFLLGKDRQVTLRCAYADFGVADGVATARAVALDTTDTALLVRGGFSFRDEALDLTLLPRPKDFSPVSVRSPLQVSGTFARPSVGPKGGPLLLRGAAVAALSAIAPPLALLGLLETGPGHDNPECGPPAPKARQQTPPTTSPGPRPPLLPPSEKDRS